MPDGDKKPQIKVYFVGEENSGKTGVIQQLTKEKKENYYDKDLGDFNLKIFDTEGSQRYRSVTIERLKNADVVIFVFNLQDKTSDDLQNMTFEELDNYWLKKALQLKKPKFFVFIRKENGRSIEKTETICLKNKLKEINKKFQQEKPKEIRKEPEIDNSIILLYNNDKGLESKLKKKLEELKKKLDELKKKELENKSDSNKGCNFF